MTTTTTTTTIRPRERQLKLKALLEKCNPKCSLMGSRLPRRRAAPPTHSLPRPPTRIEACPRTTRVECGGKANEQAGAKSSSFFAPPPTETLQQRSTTNRKGDDWLLAYSTALMLLEKAGLAGGPCSPLMPSPLVPSPLVLYASKQHPRPLPHLLPTSPFGLHHPTLSSLNRSLGFSSLPSPGSQVEDARTPAYAAAAAHYTCYMQTSPKQ
ncbi:hypothetical protein IWX49DRAFT_388334 [Phyllosticta citricarpa]|uniref:Uncharacterized protein n=1 Tax=Phyllosticta citricarpa TaxID=55181 RepID=A0ABR1L399_9PEZI